MARQTILAWLDRVTTDGSPELVPPRDRIGVFDNDGTLWCERPTYTQAFFIMERLHKQAAADPELAARPVVQSLLAGDLAAALERGLEEVAGVLLQTHAGLTAEEFASATASWFDRSIHPRFGVPFLRLAYQPMLELMDLLRASGFRVFVVTGGGVEFVRAISEDLFGIPPDDVIGTAVQMAVARRDGRMVLVRQPALLGPPNEGEPKPLNIQAHIGRRPIFAGGNSAGDREMLEYATTGPLPSLAIVIDHDDEAREYSYASASLTDPRAEPITESAARLGWTAVSMRTDWSAVFGPGIDP